MDCVKEEKEHENENGNENGNDNLGMIFKYLQRLRVCIEECIIDSTKFDKYEDRVRLLFHFSNCDPCVLVPKTRDLNQWHVSFFANIDLMGILHNLLRRCKNMGEQEKGKRQENGTRNGIAENIFVAKTIDEILRIVVLLGNTFRGYQIMAMNLKSFHKLLCEMNATYKNKQNLMQTSEFESKYQVLSSMKELLHSSSNHVIYSI